MAKADPDELLDRWRDAEAHYRRLVDEIVGPGSPGKVRKPVVLSVEEARAKADRRRDKFFRQALK